MRVRPAIATALSLVLLLAACGSDVPVRSTGVDLTSTTLSAPASEGSVPVVELPSTVVPPPMPPPPTALPAPPVTELTGSTPGLPAGEDTTVESVVDGDTIVVAGGTRVRLIGVDTPETKDPRKPVQCFGREASAYTESLVAPGTVVRLVYDVERLDRYARTLAYVYRRSDGTFVNAALVSDGYALVATFPPNVAHVEEFTALARVAREEGRGLWSACGGEPGAAAPAPIPASAPPASAGSSCEASYPGVCIPPAPPDLDCGDIPHRRFQVVPPDPHGFDGNSDGVGCEG
ncbi:hypothetical protein BH24ACT1_BH24ACT1_10000 [soil metagenome]